LLRCKDHHRAEFKEEIEKPEKGISFLAYCKDHHRAEFKEEIEKPEKGISFLAYCKANHPEQLEFFLVVDVL
jgi:hypothetical protein